MIVSRIAATGGLIGTVAVVLAALSAGGCKGLDLWPNDAVRQEVPKPLDLLLPQKIRLHPFTGTRVFSADGGITGIDVRIEAMDAYDDTGKAFGDFRFELYAYDPYQSDHKGKQLAIWPVDINDPKVNRTHWNSISRTYQFKLAWKHPIPVGQKFVLRAVFQSRFTQRLFDERVFVSGQ